MNSNNHNDRQLGLGTWIAAGSPVVTEMLASMGFDWLLFDLEHGCMAESDVMANLHAASRFRTRIIVRIGEFRPAFLGRLLDWGAAGIMMPHVSSASEAARVVDAMRYPPMGSRGFSSSARVYDYGATAPDSALVHQPIFMAQIENLEGVMSVDEIAAVEGVDVLFVGPRDLGLDLSVRPSDHTMNFDRAIERVAASATLHSRQAGILVRNNTDLPKLRDMGYTALAAGSDLGVLRSGYEKLLNIFNNK